MTAKKVRFEKEIEKLNGDAKEILDDVEKLNGDAKEVVKKSKKLLFL